MCTGMWGIQGSRGELIQITKCPLEYIQRNMPGKVQCDFFKKIRDYLTSMTTPKWNLNRSGKVEKG